MVPVYLQRDLQYFRGSEQAFDVVLQPKDGRSHFGGVRPRPLEDARAVLESRRKYVNARIAPRNERAVQPDMAIAVL
jgi:hypothetical protein